MTEEEARAKLKTRLDRWQVYLGDEKPFVTEPIVKGATVSNGIGPSTDMSLALAIVPEKSEDDEADGPTATAGNGRHDSNVSEQAARIAALEAAVAYEREQTRRLSETMAREQRRMHTMTPNGMSPHHLSPNGHRATDDLSSVFTSLSDAPVSPIEGERRQAVLILISVASLLGLCGIFLYLLLAM